MKRLPWNWRDRIEVVIDPDDYHYCRDLTVTLRFKRGQTPRGYSKYVGSIYVAQYSGDPRWWVEESNVEEKFQGKGLGKLLYTTALKECKSLTTRYHNASEEAQRVWKSLIRHRRHEMDFMKGTLTVYYGRR